MKSLMLRRPLAVVSALLLAGVATAATPVEDKWEITTSMEMTGMPFKMPPTTTTICVPQGQQSTEKMVPKQDNCTVSGFKVTGATSRYHVECPAPQKMSGDGEFTTTGKDAYRGSMNAKMDMEGTQTEMKMTYAGRKLGVCGAGDAAISPTAIMKQQKEMTAQSCTQMADGMSWQNASAMTTMCPTMQKDICTRAKKLFAPVKTSSDVVALQEKRPDWKGLAGYCGIDANVIAKNACVDAKKTKNWNNAVLVCGEDAELEAIAKKECTGMNYTGAQGGEYAPLCDHYADKLPKAKTSMFGSMLKAATGGSSSNEKAAAAPAPAAQDDSAQKAVEGLKALKGLFKH